MRRSGLLSFFYEDSLGGGIGFKDLPEVLKPGSAGMSENVS